MNTAEAALSQVVAHLTTIRAKSLEAVGGTLSQAQLEANQAEIDQAVAAINSLAGTMINGKRLLDGSQDFVVTGVNSSQVREVIVLNRNTQQTIDTIAGTIDTLTVSGNALTFQIDAMNRQPATISLQSVSSARLGGQSGTLNEVVTGGWEELARQRGGNYREDCRRSALPGHAAASSHWGLLQPDT